MVSPRHRARASVVVLLAVVTLALALAPGAGHAASKPVGDGAPAPSIVNPDDHDLVPWQAALVARQGNTIALPLQVFCGGTIRDATHVITAAHCVPDTDAAELAVVVGAFSRSDPGATAAQALAVSAITSHPLFGVAPGNDLAVLTLASPIDTPSAAALGPVAPNANDVGSLALISGWGDEDPVTQGAQQPDELAYAVIRVYPDSRCANYGDSYVPATMLCAGDTQGDVTKDSCQGDSGGPLARLDAGGAATALIGVVSFGVGCADPAFPGVYTRLANADLNARAWAATPPPRLEPVAAPAVNGTVRAGETVTCAGDTWTDPAPQREVTWLSAALDGQGRAVDVRVDGQGATLALGDGTVGRVLTCAVRATNAGGARESQAPVVGPVGARAPAPGPGPAPGPRPGPGPAVRPPPDLGRPTAALTRRHCSRRRCRLTIRGTDAASAVTGARATVRRLTGCRRGRRGRACRRTRALRVTRTGSGLFAVTTGRLAKGRYRFTVTVLDAAGNRSRPVSVVLTVR